MDFLALALSTIALLGLAFEFHLRTRAPLGHTILASNCGVICVLYLSALVGLLPVVFWILLLVGLYAFVRAIDRNRTEQLNDFRNPIFVLFVVGCLIIFIATRGVLLVVWDEFSHWGAAAKFILTTNRLAQLPGEIMFPSYPVGEALFVYFISKISPSTEGNWIYAHAVLQFSSIVVLLATLKKNGWIVGALLLAIALGGGYFFAEAFVNWTSLLVDTQISYLFGAALVIMFIGRGSTSSLICLIPIVACLPIIKEVGALFAAVIVALFLLDRLFVALWEGTSIRSIAVRKVWLVVVLAMLPMAMVSAWTKHMAAIGVRPVFDTSWLKIQKRIMEADFPSTLLSVLQKSASVFDGSILIGNTYSGLATWIIVLTGVTVFAIAAQERVVDRFRIALLYFGMIGLVFANAVLVIYHYAVAFTPYEAVNFASFGRYMSPILVAAFFLLLGAAASDLGDGMRRHMAAIVLAGLFAVQMFAIGGPVAIALTGGARADEFSKKIMPVRRTVKGLIESKVSSVPEDARVYAIWNNTSGLEFYIALFELKPRRTNSGCFSVGPPRSKSDVWSCNWSLDEFRAHMKIYDYFFIGHADEVFWSHYETLFAPGARATGAAFFRVQRNEAGMLLVPM